MTLPSFGIVPERHKNEKAKKKPAKRQPKVKITEVATRIKGYLQLSWPGVESKYELEFHQRNFDYSSDLHRRLRVLETKLFKVGRQYKVVHWLVSTIASPAELTIWWAHEVNKAAWLWPMWQGKLLKWVLTDKTEKLNQKLARHVADYCGDGALWDEIKRLLKAENSK